MLSGAYFDRVKEIELKLIKQQNYKELIALYIDSGEIIYNEFGLSKNMNYERVMSQMKAILSKDEEDLLDDDINAAMEFYLHMLAKYRAKSVSKPKNTIEPTNTIIYGLLLSSFLIVLLFSILYIQTNLFYSSVSYAIIFIWILIGAMMKRRSSLIT